MRSRARLVLAVALGILLTALASVSGATSADGLPSIYHRFSHQYGVALWHCSGDARACTRNDMLALSHASPSDDLGIPDIPESLLPGTDRTQAAHTITKHFAHGSECIGSEFVSYRGLSLFGVGVYFNLRENVKAIACTTSGVIFCASESFVVGNSPLIVGVSNELHENPGTASSCGAFRSSPSHTGALPNVVSNLITVIFLKAAIAFDVVIDKIG